MISNTSKKLSLGHHCASASRREKKRHQLERRLRNAGSHVKNLTSAPREGELMNYDDGAADTLGSMSSCVRQARVFCSRRRGA